VLIDTFVQLGRATPGSTAILTLCKHLHKVQMLAGPLL